MKSTKIPKLIVFDLDNCIWYPEMYMLWGGGPPFIYDGKYCYDSKKTKIYLMGYVEQFLNDFAQGKYPDTRLGIASRCDEPDWARKCLQLFQIQNKPIEQLFTYQEIYKGSKINHFKSIQKKSGVNFKDMIFFDDQYENIRDVASLGVIAIHTPDGFEKQSLQKALQLYNN